jgi:PQQ-like domain
MVRRALVTALGALGLAACGAGGGGTPVVSAARDSAESVFPGHVRDWPMFGVGPGRANVYRGATGITGRNVAHLRRTRVALPGTVDSSPIFLHAVRVRGRRRDVIVVTTTYGRTLALAAYTGRVLWEFTPPGYRALVGTYRITNASPVADSGRRYVYAPAPDGRIYKLSLASGASVHAGAWPVRATLFPEREKLPSALAVFGRDVLVTTDGYIGDAPPYQAHYMAIDRASGRSLVFNSLCSERHRLQRPQTCPQSGGAMFGRGSPVVDAKHRIVWTATGNAVFDGRRDWGDSVLALTLEGRRLRSWTPPNQAFLSTTDTDLGSAAPALLPDDLLVQGGKEGKLFLLDRRAPGRGPLQTLSTPGGAPMFTTAAVDGNRVFVATGGGIDAYTVRHRRLAHLWSHARGGTSPVLAGGLLFVFDPGGALVVYGPRSGRVFATLPAGSGHWGSPVVAAGHAWLPEGDGNDHSGAGALDIYRLP